MLSQQAQSAALFLFSGPASPSLCYSPSLVRLCIAPRVLLRQDPAAVIAVSPVADIVVGAA